MTKTNLKILERKLITQINFDKASITRGGADAKIYNNALRKATDIVRDVFNDLYATNWLEESEDKRYKDLITK